MLDFHNVKTIGIIQSIVVSFFFSFVFIFLHKLYSSTFYIVVELDVYILTF